jgi:hypothetical protein
LLVFLLSAVAALADDKGGPATEVAEKCQLTAAELRAFYTDPGGRIVTEWTDMEHDIRLFRIFTKAGYATVLTEGKMEDGQMVFRKGYKHVNDTFPDAAKLMWYTYNGIDEEFFDSQTRKLLTLDFTLMRMQRFVDDEGEARFCAIWVKFTPGTRK